MHSDQRIQSGWCNLIEVRWALLSGRGSSANIEHAIELELKQTRYMIDNLEIFSSNLELIVKYPLYIIEYKKIELVFF